MCLRNLYGRFQPRKKAENEREGKRLHEEAKRRMAAEKAIRRNTTMSLLPRYDSLFAQFLVDRVCKEISANEDDRHNHNPSD